MNDLINGRTPEEMCDYVRPSAKMSVAIPNKAPCDETIWLTERLTEADMPKHPIVIKDR